MIWIYKNLDNKVISSRNFNDVKGDYIELERMIPEPYKLGYYSILHADFESKKVWFELEPTFQQVKKEKIEEIRKYDSSSEVNDFTINGVHMWLDSTMRNKVRENLETCEKLGEESTTLRFGGMVFPVTVEQGWDMYYAVLAYARDSWNVTENHLAAIDKLETIEEIINYDYKSGYPDKLVF